MAARRTLMLAAALTLTAAAAGGCTSQQEPAPPAPAPLVDPAAPGAGELVSAEPITLRSYPKTKAWRITYRSTTSTGTPDIVSGTVITPADAGQGAPIVGFAPGTLGLGDQCAQSRNLDRSLDPGPSEKEFIQRYTSSGYAAVAITDYQGLGTPGGYPYDVGRSEGHALLDVLRAAQHVPGSNLSPTAPVAVAGYSQGGLATGWAAQLAAGYAPELNLKGAAIGAPPADLNANVRFLDGSPYAGLVLATVYGHDVAYPELDLDRYLTAKGRAAFADLADDCVAELDSKWAGHKLSEYTTEDILARPDWQAHFTQESLGSGTPTVPVLLYTSKADDIVPYDATAKLAQTWRGRGADVTLYAPRSGGHGPVGIAMSPIASGWVLARLLGLTSES